MNIKKLLIISVITMFLFSGIAVSPGLGIKTRNIMEAYRNYNSYQNSLPLHRPISITGNDDFTAKNGITGGSGTPEDPYVISNWMIRPFKDPGIRISNTDVYFIIENCHIYGCRILKPIGIYFNNVTNGKIIACTTWKNSFGILIVSSSNNTVENCHCEGDRFGISVNGCPQGYKSSSNNNKIKNCTFSNCDDGIYFCCIPSSSNNLIESCHCLNNNRGIYLDHCVHYTTIVGCNISNNQVGVKILSASSHNHISNNVFWKNKKHAEDNCRNSWDNGPIYGGNYWSDHSSFEPFDIPGAGNNKDYYQLSEMPTIKPLVALFTYYPKYPIVHKQICFDASLSYDSENNIILYEWDFGDGTNETGCRVNHTYVDSGNYNVTLKITNETTNDTIVQTVNVVKLSDGVIHVSNNSSIQEAIDNSQSGYTIYVDNGTYQENIIVDKPYLNIIGNGSNTTIIDGGQNSDVVYITTPMINISGFTITHSADGKAGIQIGISDYMLDSVGCIIKYNNISGNSVGINMSETEQNIIADNTVANNKLFGIYAIRSFHNLFEHNCLSSNNKGIWLEYASNWNEITKNTIVNNSLGIILNWSHHNVINRNNILNNKEGIKLNNALSPTITYNNIYNNHIYGILFIDKIPDAKYNWWGSKLGPSWLLPIFGDRVWMGGTGLLKLRGTGIRLVCYPWLKQPVNI